MNKKNNLLLAASIVIFLLFIFGSSPYRLPLIFVILPLVPAVIIIVLLVKMGLAFFKVPEKIAYRITLVVGLVASVTVVLLSLGQLTIRDFSLLFAFGLVAMFYVARMFKS